MKTKNVLALAALATIGITACSNEEDVQFPDMKDVPITYTAGISDLSTSTRMTDAERLLNRDISLFLETEGTTNELYTAYNMKLHKGEDGQWKPAHELLWQDSDAEVTYYAFMPHAILRENIPADPVANIELRLHQNNTTMLDNDLCYAAVKKTTALENAGTINLNFKHVLSKLTVKLQTAKPTIEVQDLKIDSWPYAGGFKLKSGVMKTASVYTSLGLCKKDSLLFEGLLVPNPRDDRGVQRPLDFTIIIEAQNTTSQEVKKYKYVSPKPLVFESGKKYEMTLKIRNDNDADAVEQVTLGSITAEPWESTKEETLMLN